MPLLTLCHVVRTAGLLGPERVTQALKILLTVSAPKEPSHASRSVCPRVSTSQQETTDTIASPWAALHTYVAAHDHTALPAHVFLDNGVRGGR